MSYITLGYKCVDCWAEDERMIKKEDRKEIQWCIECGGVMQEMLSAPSVMRVNMTDAVGAGRFDDVREQRKLQRMARDLKKKGRKGKKERARVEKEIERVGRS